jgi:uncharacterized protein (TIGR03435 family)
MALHGTAPAIVIVLLTCAALAQTPPASFEVATVKLNKSGDRAMGNHFDPERGTWTNTPLRVLITNAYRVQSDQLLGGPDWIRSERWDIEAKTEGATTTQQKFRMLQPLLEDRFKLKVHRETREMPEYRLVIAKRGSKLREFKKEDGDTRQMGTRIGRGLIDAHGTEFNELTFFLRSELGRPVVDATGLTGKYDFKLDWVPDESQPNSGGDAPPPDATGASIFAAIQEQLGLKLEAMKGPVEVLVIDHVEKPSEN